MSRTQTKICYCSWNCQSRLNVSALYGKGSSCLWCEEELDTNEQHLSCFCEFPTLGLAFTSVMRLSLFGSALTFLSRMRAWDGAGTFSLSCLTCLHVSSCLNLHFVSLYTISHLWGICASMHCMYYNHTCSSQNKTILGMSWKRSMLHCCICSPAAALTRA